MKVEMTTLTTQQAIFEAEGTTVIISFDGFSEFTFEENMEEVNTKLEEVFGVDFIITNDEWTKLKIQIKDLSCIEVE